MARPEGVQWCPDLHKSFVAKYRPYNFGGARMRSDDYGSDTIWKPDLRHKKWHVLVGRYYASPQYAITLSGEVPPKCTAAAADDVWAPVPIFTGAYAEAFALVERMIQFAGGEMVCPLE